MCHLKQNVEKQTHVYMTTEITTITTSENFDEINIAAQAGV